ncbi:hypothetical protein F3Y22_tig00110109pilonHSYRG00049 [Hibiscus syriacus]|uniref:Uncharacterized protein n=1 Tax=Hibiscus syriacus TaxID=106335 RepID=A0A6A3BJI4_HIBSY|nr:hypothetical protein F3Y22_tig00110109pilonHSYRG00049 [Hibiscus syriacus]
MNFLALWVRKILKPRLTLVCCLDADGFSFWSKLIFSPGKLLRSTPHTWTLNDVDAAAESFAIGAKRCLVTNLMRLFSLTSGQCRIKKELAAAMKKINDQRDEERRQYRKMFQSNPTVYQWNLNAFRIKANVEHGYVLALPGSPTTSSVSSSSIKQNTRARFKKWNRDMGLRQSDVKNASLGFSGHSYPENKTSASGFQGSLLVDENVEFDSMKIRISRFD